MAREIERKFFFSPEGWNARPIQTQFIEQGYVSETGTWEVRIRRSGEEKILAMKSVSELSRVECEVPLTQSSFLELWPLTQGCRVEKTRTTYKYKSTIVDVDRYGERRNGLVVCEVEFDTLADARNFSIPAAFGPELTFDSRFKNRNLARPDSRVPFGFSPTSTVESWSIGAVPFRKGKSGWEVVVVSTRKKDRWIFPKGQTELGMTLANVARMECREEAGIQKGKIVGHPIVLPYSRETGVTNLLLYPLLVGSLSDEWLEGKQRNRAIVPLEAGKDFGPLVELGCRWLQELVVSPAK